MVKVCKFGGTSMADAKAIEQVKNIINADDERKYVIVSAPGKRFKEDIKVTDLLYDCYYEVLSTGSCTQAFGKVRDRFTQIAKDLKLDLDINSILDETEANIVKYKSEDFTASRGEYLSAQVVANYLGYTFIDAFDTIFFDINGNLDEQKSYECLEEFSQNYENAVFPGFYGRALNGKVKTFSRGGSDITGAIVARGVDAGLYENWTDVSGFMACDPRIVDNPKKIKVVSYKELRELSYMGASVLHSESIFPVRSANIPIHIKNTFAPDDEGTLIVPSVEYQSENDIVTGIAGKKDFTVISLEKSMMNAEVGFALKLLQILKNHNINFEHMPSGIDTLSVVFSNVDIDSVLAQVVEEIKEELKPNTINVYTDIALVATVGHGMIYNIGTSARLFKALAEKQINVRLIDQGSSELNIIVGVSTDDYSECIKAIYDEFFK